VHLIQTMRDAFGQFVKQGRLAAVINYSWTGLPGTESGFAIFRCSALTDAGKLALSPM
jgi:hypothetical protein